MNEQLGRVLNTIIPSLQGILDDNHLRTVRDVFISILNNLSLELARIVGNQADNGEAKNAVLTKKNNILVREIEKLEVALNEISAEINSLQIIVDSRSVEVDHLRELKHSMNAEVNHLQKRVKSMNVEVNHLRQLEDLT